VTLINGERKLPDGAECIQKQFDDFKVGDVNTNGKLVSGESIADLAGLKIAYNVYKKSQDGKPRGIIDGFTPESPSACRSLRARSDARRTIRWFARQTSAARSGSEVVEDRRPRLS